MTLAKITKYWDIITLSIVLFVLLAGALLSKLWLIPLFIETVKSLENSKQSYIDQMLSYSEIWGHMSNATLGLCVFLILAIHSLIIRLRTIT
jgi:hypothetical protein